MFAVGDKVMYGSMGVCTVLGTGVPDMPGAKGECYVLKPHFIANAKVYAPVQQNPVKMRSLLSAAQVQSLIDSMPRISGFPQNQERQEQYRLYKSVIKSADSYMLAKLLKTLHDKKARTLAQRKIVPSAEKEFFDTAEKMLHGEISVALRIPIEDVGAYIQTRLGEEEMRAAVS